MSIGLVEHISKNRAYYSILALALFNLLVMHYTITPVVTGKSFFHMVLTMSMHSPYDTFEGDDLGMSFPDNYSPEYCNY